MKRVRRLSFPARPILTAFAVVLLALPTSFVVVASFTKGIEIVFPPHGLTFHWYLAVVRNAATWHALLNSVHVALVAVVIGIAVGLPAALALPSFRPRRRLLLLLLLSLGLSTPVIVSAFSFFSLFSKIGVLSHLTVVGLALGIVNLPFMLWPIISALEDQDPELPAAAATLGADPVEQFLFIRLPLMASGIVTGAVFMFVVSITDFVVSEVLTTVNDQTLPVFIYSGLRANISPSLGAASAFFIILATLVFILVLRIGGVERFLIRR